jgi:hypothetical protein
MCASISLWEIDGPLARLQKFVATARYLGQHLDRAVLRLRQMKRPHVHQWCSEALRIITIDLSIQSIPAEFRRQKGF